MKSSEVSTLVLVSFFSLLWLKRGPDRKGFEGMNEEVEEESGVSLCLS